MILVNNRDKVEWREGMTVQDVLDAMKYDYQITWHHKEEGRMEQGWVRGVSDGYIYCVIPDDLRTRIMRTLEEKVEEVIEDVIDE